MARVGRLRRETPFYLIPIMIGLSGVLFAIQLDDPVLLRIIVILCLGVPLFVGGNVLARYQMGALQRTLLLVGMAMLALGAGYSLLGYAESFGNDQFVAPTVAQISRYLGLGGLLLGLTVVLFSVIRSQAMIEEVSERFRHVADHMADGFVLTGFDGRIVLVNRSFTDLTGIPEEQAVGENAYELAKRLGAEVVGLHTEKRTQGLASDYQVSWSPNGKGERQFFVSGSPIYDRRGRRAGAIATIRDITEQHRMSKRLEDYAQGLQRLVEERTQQLRASERLLRGLLQHMEEGFLTLDDENRVRFANERLCDLLRRDRDAILGREIFEFVEMAGRNKLREALQHADRDEDGAPNQEYTFLRGGGGQVPVKVSIAPIRDETENRLRYSLVVIDVHELKEMHRQLEVRARQLEQVNEELRRLDRAKDVFLSNVSHELRTPLSTLQGYIEMWESGSLGQVAGPQAGALRVMGRNAERLSRLINEMIEFSRMEIRGIRLNKTLFDPNQLVDEAVSSAQPQAMAKNITITYHVPEDIPDMWGDREKLLQVLGILLSNANKFSPAGSLVQVRAARADAGAIAFSVSDTGIGIAPSDHDRIFAKFFQVDSSMTRSYQGTGIGLSIAKNVVEAHGGAIALKSVERQGTTFTVLLPHALFEMGDVADFPELEELRVVVANEHPAFREAVSALLESAGCVVTQCRSGHECLRAARDEQPDAVVIDEAMPDLSGSDTVALLKEDMGTSTIPVVLFCSGAERGGHSGEELHGVSVLQKPFTAGSLVMALLKACAMSGEIGEVRAKLRASKS